MSFSYLGLTVKNIRQWQRALEEFEEDFLYPLGADHFSINHGNDYLAFFRRIGEPVIRGVTDGDTIAALGAGVISRRWQAWYLCDMKVTPRYRGRKFPRKLFIRNFFFNYLRCRRGFALNMETIDGAKNPIQKIMQTLPWTPLKVGARVLFFYADAEATQRAVSLLEKDRPRIFFVNIQSKKNLVLKSTGKGIPLLHLEWGERSPDDETVDFPQPEMLHMWCLAEDDPLVKELALVGIQPKASGLIFQHGMDKFNWSQLRTSEL